MANVKVIIVATDIPIFAELLREAASLTRQALSEGQALNLAITHGRNKATVHVTARPKRRPDKRDKRDKRGFDCSGP